jgi:hypothetical protein
MTSPNSSHGRVFVHSFLKVTGEAWQISDCNPITKAHNPIVSNDTYVGIHVLRMLLHWRNHDPVHNAYPITMQKKVDTRIAPDDVMNESLDPP